MPIPNRWQSRLISNAFLLPLSAQQSLRDFHPQPEGTETKINRKGELNAKHEPLVIIKGH